MCKYFEYVALDSWPVFLRCELLALIRPTLEPRGRGGVLDGAGHSWIVFQPLSEGFGVVLMLVCLFIYVSPVQ